MNTPFLTLPNLSTLSINDDSLEYYLKVRWLRACGPKRPNFKKWDSLRGPDKKRLMHDVAAEADHDKPDTDNEDGNYLTPYKQVDIDDLIKRSVEHVLPRSFELVDNGSKNDPNGWMTADMDANAKRSNHYLMLWPDQEDGKIALPGTLVRFNGQIHYVPPLEQRARLARKWMYMRATYSGDLKPPSRAQRLYSPQIVALANRYDIQPAEQRVNDLYESMFQWSNPLLKPNAQEWYDDVQWRNLVFS